jgi:hypothetical protein
MDGRSDVMKPLAWELVRGGGRGIIRRRSRNRDVLVASAASTISLREELANKQSQILCTFSHGRPMIYAFSLRPFSVNSSKSGYG